MASIGNLNRWGDQVARQLAELWDPDERASKKGASKGDNGDPCLRKPRQSGRKLHCAADVDERMVAAEQRIDRLDTAATEHSEEIKKLRDKLDALEKRDVGVHEAVERTQQAAQAAQTAAEQAAAGVAQARRSTASSSSERTVARMGNLGWNKEERILLERAQQVLSAARVDTEHYAHVTAAIGRGEKGSACEFHFHKNIYVENAKFAVIHLRRQTEGVGGCCENEGGAAPRSHATQGLRGLAKTTSGRNSGNSWGAKP